MFINSSDSPKCCFSYAAPSATTNDGPIKQDFNTAPFFTSAPSQMMQFSITALQREEKQ